jgi:uncharacterized protein (DUF4415 family)
MKDSDIDYTDIPALDESFFRKATVPWPPGKELLTIRLDRDIVEWLKAPGPGYQTRINRYLRMMMEAGERNKAQRKKSVARKKQAGA